MKRILFLLCIVLFSSCAIMCKSKPDFNKTRWVGVYQIFVADAGYETHTETLEFTSRSTYKKESLWELPPYPAMYMNADGTVDTMPGHSSRFTEEGTYSFQDGRLTLSPKDGKESVLEYRGDTLVGMTFFGLEVVYRRDSK